MPASSRAGSSWLLKLLYWYTIVGAGGCGLVVVLTPAAFVALLGLPPQDALVLGVAGALWLGSGVVAALGLRAPTRFAPIFLVQCAYKTIWLLAVFVPRAVGGAGVPFYGWLFAAIFLTYVVLDVIVIRAEGLLARRSVAPGVARAG